MLGRSGQIQPTLTYTKFAPAHPDKAIKWAGAQIWQGPARSQSLLVADCIDEEWAKTLAVAYNDALTLNSKVASANQVLRDLLAAVSESAQGYKVTDPLISEALAVLVTNFKTQAKKAGLSPG